MARRGVKANPTGVAIRTARAQVATTKANIKIFVNVLLKSTIPLSFYSTTMKECYMFSVLYRATDKEEDEDKAKRKEQRKERKEKERKKKRDEDDGEGEWETVKGGVAIPSEKPKMFAKDAEINITVVLKKLSEIIAARGKKRTDRREQIELLHELQSIADAHNLGATVTVKIKFSIVSSIFDYNPKVSDAMKPEYWSKYVHSKHKSYDAYIYKEIFDRFIVLSNVCKIWISMYTES